MDKGADPSEPVTSLTVHLEFSEQGDIQAVTAEVSGSRWVGVWVFALLNILLISRVPCAAGRPWPWA